MKRFRFLSSLRARLTLLILLTLIPALIIMLYNAAESRQREADKVQVDVLTLSQLAASQEEQVIESARQVLISLSLARDVRSGDATACTVRLAELIQEYQGYTAFTVADPNGNVFCRSVPTTETTNIAGTFTFDRALELKDFVVGDYAIGRVTGKPTIGMCYPSVVNDQPQFVVCTGLNLDLLNQQVTGFQLPESSTLLMVDRQGTVLVHYPGSGSWIGENLADDPVVNAMLSQAEGKIEVTDTDSIKRFYAFTPVQSRTDTGIRLAIGIPTELAFAEVNNRLARNLLIMGLVAATSLALAWWATDVVVLRRLNQLVGATDRFSAGDLNARVGWPDPEGEMGRLGQAFDSMAATIQQREAERRESALALYEQREWLRITLASIGDAVIATDVDGKINFLNPVAQSLTGWAEAEAIGKPLTTVFKIVNAQTGKMVEDPVAKVIRDGAIVGLANHTRLIAKDGRGTPIDDSAAPLKDNDGKLVGVVLIFRDITEREKAEDALRFSRDQLAVILEGAANGITAQDTSGRLHYANDTAAQVVGYASAAELIAAPSAERLQRFEIYDELGQPFPLKNLPGRVAAQTGLPTSAMLRYRVKATGSEHWSMVRATPIFNASGQVELAVSIFQDITDLKQAELAQRVLAEAAHLLSSELDVTRRLNGIAQMAVPIMADWSAVDVLDEEGAIKRVAVHHSDPAKVEMAYELQRRYPPDPNSPTGVPHVLHSGQSEFYPVFPTEAFAAAAPDEDQRQLIRDLNINSVMVVPLVAHGRTLGALSFVWAESGRHYSQADLELAEELGRRAGLAVDNAQLYDEMQRLNAELEERIHERTAQLEESQMRLRQLSAHLQAAREEERARIAREIHDELGQILTVLKIDLASVQRALHEPPQAVGDKLKGMSKLIDSTVQQVRRIATELRPGILDDLGLAAAIEAQLTEFEERTGIKCELLIDLDESFLNGEGRLALFRIFQETLTNVARHAQATAVIVKLAEEDGQIVLRVSDNGRGITEADMAQSRSFGVLGMRERVSLLRGEFSIQGVDGQGTTIVVRLPITGNQLGSLSD